MTPLANKQGQLAPLKDVSPDAILERYLAEENGTQIAESYGVTRAALSYFMLKHAEEQWKSAQLVKALTRKDQADQLLETADNQLELARAREMLRSAQWDLEKVCRRIYGQDLPAAQSAVQININLRRDSERPNGALDLAGVRDETHSHVQPQHYDSEAPQHEAIMPAVSVDKTDK